MSSSNISYQRFLVVVSVVLFLVKLLAWFLTGSVAILTDALESTVNVIAGFIGLYSITLSHKPKDNEHPYGHGKVEFISAAIEGTLISIAGVLIIFKGVDNLLHPHTLKKLDYGLILIAFTALINYVVGWYVVKHGKINQSPILIASGAHLQSDTYSTIGLLVGISLVMFTGFTWIDSIAALIFAGIIIFTGYKIIRKAISGIMDEKDAAIIDEIVDILNKNRYDEWIDVHNMRVINYAGFYHIDCHLTVPFYKNLHEAHMILDKLTHLFTSYFQQKVEFFIHVDGCLFSQCKICSVHDCPYREANFVKHINWTHDNIISNQKHTFIP